MYYNELIDFLGKILLWIVLTIIVTFSTAIRKIFYKKKLAKKELKFDEFDDIEASLKQEEHEKNQLLIDWEILNRVTNEANIKIALSETEQEYSDAKKTLKRVEKDIENFRFLDSVEVEEDKIYEGSTITSIKENGINIDTKLFKKWCKEILKCIKSGTEEELKAIRYFIAEEMYDKLIDQKRKFEQDGLDFITDELIIKDCKLIEYGNWLEKEEIKVLIKVKMKEYIIQKSTNRILRGSNRKFSEKNIIMTFLKQNINEKEGFITNCPNCGAETTQTSLGKCRYCDTLVFPIRYNWVLTKFETM